MTTKTIQLPQALIPAFIPKRGDHYVYIHIRKDNGKVFYVGKGMRKRAYSHHSRNIHWHRVVKKAGYEVYIVRYFNTHKEALDYEVAMIAACKHNGKTLTNMTDGGDGTIGYIQSAEQRRKNGDANRGRYAGKKNPMCRPEVAAKMGLTKIGNKNCVKKDIYTFYHKTHGTEICTPYDLRNKYSLNQTYISKLVNGVVKHAKGWSVVERTG